MKTSTHVHTYVTTTVLLALGSWIASLLLSPPTLSQAPIQTFAILFALVLLGAALELTFTEGGSTTSIDFIPQLAGVVLLEPGLAITLAATSQPIAEFVLLRKPTLKAAFNSSQLILAVVAAAWLYVLFGGNPSASSLDFRYTFGPFLVAVLAYFALNTLLVSRAIALAENEPFLDVWVKGPGRLLLFDLLMSPLAYLVAFLYARYEALGLVAAVVPIFGLRYTFGIIRELHQLNRDLLSVLIRTIEARDEYTSGHSLRVAERSRRIARSLGIWGNQLRIIETAALLHDIGKIDLAYGEILRQTGPLTPAQRELIRSHPDKGVTILSAVRSIDPEILACIRHHHEWYDGAGYPAGIAGDRIPIGARIIMVSDSIDAMLTDRPYRKALTVDQVEDELRRNSGTQFDPKIVNMVLELNLLDEAASHIREARIKAADYAVQS